MNIRLVMAVCFMTLFSSTIFGQTAHFSFNDNTGNNATVDILVSTNPNIDGVTLTDGDEIAVFSPAGLCVGAVIWNNANTSITIWGDNDQTGEVDGITPGELISFRVWDQSENKEYSNVNVTYDSNSNFISNGLYSINGLYNLLSLSVIPPPKPKITISETSLPNFGNVIINTTSESKTYTVSGDDLTENITITAPIGFQISRDNITFFSSVNLPNSSGTVASTTVYVTFGPTSTIAYSGYIEHSSTGAANQNLSISGTGVEAPKLNITPSERTVDPSTGNTEFNVTSNTDWTVSDDAAWLIVSPSNGSGDGILTVNYEENTSTNQRVGTINITGGGITRAATITQSAAPFTLTVSPSNQTLGNSQGSTTFTVVSNTEWTVSDDAAWLIVSPINGSGDGTLTITYENNTSTIQRVGTITITGGGITRTITVTQSEAPFTLAVSPSNQTVANSQGSTTFTVTSNSEWTVSDDAAWLTVSPNNGSGEATLTITYENNTSTNQRVGTITITGGGITRTITVTQSEAPFTLAVSPSNQTVANSQGSTTFTVTSNTEWTVSDDAPWLTASPNNGSGDGTLTVIYEENTSTNQRAGTITIIGGGITKNVTVTQDGTPYMLIVSPSDRPVTYTAGSTTFSILSNSGWSIDNNTDWLVINPTSGNNNGTVTATFTENTIASQRVGTITISGIGITKTVTVTQSAAPANVEVSPTNRSVSYLAGSTIFNVTSNTNWNISDDADWLIVSPTSGSNNESLSVSFIENTTTSQRIGTITISAGGIVWAVTVTQAAAPFSLFVSPSDRFVSYLADSTTFTVTSNTNWTLSDNAEWLTVSPASGSGNGTLKAKFEENKGTNHRVATIIMIGGGISRTVTVTQDASTINTLTINPSNQDIQSTAGNTTFSVTSNINWTVNDNVSWLTVNPSSGSDNGTITVTYEGNTSTSQRVGTISVNGGGITRTATITQSAAPFTLTVTPSNQPVANLQGSTTLTVASNTDWIVSDNVPWLTVSPNIGSGNGTITATYSENLSTIQRAGTITITGGGITKTAIITQSAAPFRLTVSPSNQTVANSQGSTTFTIASNTEWTVSDDAAWFSVSPNNGSGDGTLIVAYEGNTSPNQRVGTITITGEGISKTVNVSQIGNTNTLPNITLQPGNQVVSEGQTATFRVEATCSGPLGFQWWGVGSNQWNVGDKDGRLTVVNTSNSSILTITNVNFVLDNNNEFTCEVKNLNNYPTDGYWINSNTAYLQVVSLLTVSPGSRVVDYQSGSTTFTITSNTNWTTSDDAEWLTISPVNGSNNGILTVSYEENPAPIERSGTITISGGGITRILTINQNPAQLSLTVSPSNRPVESSEGITTFSVTSNISWNITDDADWLTVSSTNNNGNGIITVTYTDNITASNRLGTINISGGGITRTVTVMQDAPTSITLLINPANQDVSHLGGATIFLLTSNTSWTISQDVDWITISPTNGSNNETIRSTYAQNTTTVQRVGTITFSAGGILRTATITQSASPYVLAVSPSDRPVEYTAGSTTFSILSNDNWSINDDAEWLVISPTSGNSNGLLTVTYTENSAISQRVGTITIPGVGITRSVTVTQAASPAALEVSPTELYLVSTAGSTSFTLLSNTSWTVIDDADWLIVSPTSGSNNQTFTLNFGENNTGDQRVGTITILGSGMTGMVRVFQAGYTAIQDLKFINSIPSEYVLFDNYPNPFNPTTSIEFGVPEESTSQLKVYDIIGNEITTLLDNETLNPGKYRYELNAQDLTSGIYIYVFISQSNKTKAVFRALKKMILLK
jgi:hypothetical protein